VEEAHDLLKEIRIYFIIKALINSNNNSMKSKLKLWKN